MSDGNDVIIHLIVGLIKKTLNEIPWYTLLNRLEVLEEILTLKLIFQIMQEKLI